MLAQEKLRLEAEFRSIQVLAENLKIKYEEEISKLTEMENNIFLIKKDVNEACMKRVELESHLKGLTNGINFYRQLYEEEIHELQAQNSDTSVAKNNFLDMEDILAEIKA